MTFPSDLEQNLKAFIIRNSYDEMCRTTPEDLAEFLAQCMEDFLELQICGNPDCECKG